MTDAPGQQETYTHSALGCPVSKTAMNLDGFNNAMQKQRDKYEGKNVLIQWFYSVLSKNIGIIS